MAEIFTGIISPILLIILKLGLIVLPVYGLYRYFRHTSLKSFVSEESILRSSTTNYTFTAHDDASYTVDFNGRPGTSYLEIRLPWSIPELFLDGHAGDASFGSSQYFFPEQKLTLEGDFNNYFQLYAPKGFEQFALTIFTPDFMQILVNSSQKYDVHIYNRKMNIYSKTKLHKNPEALEQVTATASQLIKELEEQILYREADFRTNKNIRLKKDKTDTTLKLGTKEISWRLFVHTMTYWFSGILLIGFSVESRASGNFPNKTTFTIFIIIGIACLVAPFTKAGRKLAKFISSIITNT